MNVLNKTILVTGGAGFIGSHVVDELLVSGPGRIVVFDTFVRGTRDNLADALKDPRVEIYPGGGDVRRKEHLREAMRGVDCVFHLAALRMLYCREHPEEAFEVNIRGAFNVLEACRDAGVRKLIYSSSGAVYGNALETPMTEEHPYNNCTIYGATKIAAEHLCRAFHRRYGLDYLALRYMNVYGPRQDRKVGFVSPAKLLDRIDRGLPPVIRGDGDETYDLVHVRDVARANICALQSGATDDFFNIGSGAATSLRDVCGLVLELTESDLDIIREPGEQRSICHRQAGVEKAGRELGFKPRISLRDGLKQLISWRRNGPDRNE